MISMSRALIGGLALVVVTAAVTSRVASQDAARGEDYSVPGKGHDVLNGLAGEWDWSITHWSSPDAEPETSHVTVDYRWIFGGRYLVGNYEGYVRGEAFKAREVLGFDRFRQEYNSLWIDNTTTNFVLSKGRFDKATKTLVLEGTEDDVERDRRDVKFKLVYRVVGPEELAIEYRRETSPGRMFKAAEVKATRLE